MTDRENGWRNDRDSAQYRAMSVADRERLKQFLVSTPFFGGLSDESLDTIMFMLTPRALPQGALVFEQGDTGRAMFIIEDGEILMKRRGRYHDVKLVRLHRGDFFGETTLIEMQPRPCAAEAVTAARLWELTSVNLYRLYKEDIKAYVLVLQNINRELVRRLRHADDRITELADELGDEGTQIHSAPHVTRHKP